MFDYRRFAILEFTMVKHPALPISEAESTWPAARWAQKGAPARSAAAPLAHEVAMLRFRGPWTGSIIRKIQEILGNTWND